MVGRRRKADEGGGEYNEIFDFIGVRLSGFRGFGDL